MIAEPMIEVTLRVANSLKEVAAEAWDACANPVMGRDHGNGADLAPREAQENALEDQYNPFISYDFLSSLELSQSVRTRGGWQPLHLLAEDSNGTLVGAVPCYAKTHSQGEYVFDHGWAEAYERAGGSYYPKLQVSVPFTPATGRRLLVRPGPEADAVRGALADSLMDICRRSNASSAHVTFPTEPKWTCSAAAASSSGPTSNSIGRMPATIR